MERRPPRKSVIKVVHLITRLELGGAQGNTLYTVENLSSDRYETHLWTGPGGYWDTIAIKKFGSVKRVRFFSHLVRPINPLFDVWIILDLVRAFRKEKPDILHTHSSKAGIVGRIAGKIAGVPLIVHTFHGFGFNNRQRPWTRALFLLLEKLCAPLTDRFIFVSEANRREAEQKMISVPNRSHLIRSGVSLAAFRANQSPSRKKETRIKLKIGDEPVLVTIGPFKAQKNLLDFINVIFELKKDHPSLKALVVGDGEQRSMLENRIAQLDLTQTVQLLGWRIDTADILAAADIFVMTSLWEGLPRSLVEAMASGLPAVCYDTDGVHDLLGKAGGILVPQGDRDGMVQSLHSLLINNELRNRLGKEAAGLIGPDFDIDVMVRQQDELYLKYFHAKN